MKTTIFLGLLLQFVLFAPALAQYYTTTSPASAATEAALAADMSASSVFASLATATPQQQSGEGCGPGEAGCQATGNAGGAAGSDTTGFSLSKGGMIAIIVAVVVVAIFGIVSTVLFYVAKKRSWEVRATLRRSAKRVATALTPRRSEFPSSVKQGRRNSRRIDEVPPTPKVRGFDLEKGSARISASEVSESSKPSSKWARKSDR